MRRHGKKLLLMGFLAAAGLLVWLVSKSDGAAMAQQSRYQYDNRPVQMLDGEWAFVWKQLLDPAAFADLAETDPAAIRYVQVPAMWNIYTHIPWEDAEKMGTGFGTFRLEVQGITPGETYGFRIRNLGTAARLWFNGDLVHSNGQVGETKEATDSSYEVHYIDYTPNRDTLELVIQISNFEYARGGFWDPIEMGSAEAIKRLHELNMAKSYVGIGILFTIVFFALALLYYSQRKWGPLYLGAGTLLVLAYILTTGDKLLLQWAPGIGSKVVRIQYILMYLGPPLLIGYIKAVLNLRGQGFILFQKLVRVYWIVMVGGAVVQPLYDLTRTAYFGNTATLVTIAVLLLFIAGEGIRTQPDAVLIIAAFFILGLGVAYDFLFSATLVYASTGELLPAAYVAAIMFLAVYLARYLKRAHDVAMEMPLLEQAYYNAQIKPHFLFNALNSIVSLIAIDSKAAEEMTLNLAAHLRHLISAQNRTDLIPIRKELELLGAYADIEKMRFSKIAIEVRLDESAGFSLPPYTLQPLVENAIKHGIRRRLSLEGARIAIDIGLESSGKVKVAVEDNGRGMDEEELERVRKTLERRQPPRWDGSDHLGLFNVDKRLKRTLGTGLQIKSTYGEGTVVSFLADNEKRS